MKWKRFKLLCMAACCSLIFAFTAHAGRWHHDGTNWKYMDGDSYTVNTWIQDNGKWYFLDASGIMHTGWLLYQNDWYYLEPNGEMVSGSTRELDGVHYEFDDSGKWNDPGKNGFTGQTYANEKYNYSITLPDTYMFDTDYLDSSFHFFAEKDSVIVAAFNMQIESGKQFIDYVNELTSDASDYGEVPSVVDTWIGGYQYKYIQASYYDAMMLDVYMRQSGADIVCFMTFYPTSASDEINAMMKSIKKVR